MFQLHLRAVGASPPDLQLQDPGLRSSGADPWTLCRTSVHAGFHLWLTQELQDSECHMLSCLCHLTAVTHFSPETGIFLNTAGLQKLADIIQVAPVFVVHTHDPYSRTDTSSLPHSVSCSNDNLSRLVAGLLRRTHGEEPRAADAEQHGSFQGVYVRIHQHGGLLYTRQPLSCLVHHRFISIKTPVIRRRSRALTCGLHRPQRNRVG